MSKRVQGNIQNLLTVKIGPESIELLKEKRIAEFSEGFYDQYVVVFIEHDGRSRWMTYPSEIFHKSFSFIDEEETDSLTHVVMKY